MSQDHNDFERHVSAAAAAFEGGRYEEARRHLSAAQVEGAPHTQVSAMLREIDGTEANLRRQLNGRLYGAFAVLGFGYLALSLTNPFQLGPAWYAITFLAVPIIAGVFCAKSIPDTEPRSARFARAAWVVGLSVLIFAFVNVFQAHRGISTTDGAEQLPMIAIVVGLAYGAAGALVAGTTAATLGGGRA